MKKSDKKRKTIYISIAIVGILLIGVGIKISLNKVNDSIQFRNATVITDINVVETHYIDKSLINIPISVPYEISPSTASVNDISITSSDSSILTVNEDNTVTALQKGEVTLTLVASNNKDVTAKLRIVIE